MMTKRNTASVDEVVFKMIAFGSNKARRFFRVKRDFSNAESLQEAILYNDIELSRITKSERNANFRQELLNQREFLLSFSTLAKNFRDELLGPINNFKAHIIHPVLGFVRCIDYIDGYKTERIEITKRSAYEWAKQEHNIEITPWALCSHELALEGPNESEPEKKNGPTPIVTMAANWEDVTIQLLAKNKISFATGSQKPTRRDLEKTDLLNNRTKEFTKAGVILRVLAESNSFNPAPGKIAKSADKKAMSVLRSYLKALTSIETDPFHTFTKSEGWKPHFKVIDRRNAAEQRARDKAIDVPIEEGHQTANVHGSPVGPYSRPNDEYTFNNEEFEDDDASKFLKNQDQ